MNDGPDQPRGVRATTTPCPPLALKINPALTTLMMASPFACRSTSLGIAFSGICWNWLMIAAQRFTVSCSVASAIATARDDIARTKNTFFIGCPCCANSYRKRCTLNAIGLRRISSAHVAMSQYFVWLRHGHFMTLHCKPEQRPLFRSKCLYGVHASGAVGWEETSKKRCAREHKSRGNER